MRQDSGVLRVPDDVILEAAVVAFARDGIHGASMSMIATAAGTTKPTLYAHFGDKDGLLTATLAREKHLLLTHLFAAYDRVEGDSMANQVHNDVEAIFTYAAARPHGFELLYGDWSSPPVLLARREVVARVEERVRGLVLAYVQGHDGFIVTDEGAAVVASLIVSSALRGASLAVGGSSERSAAIARATSSYVLSAMRGIDVRDL